MKIVPSRNIVLPIDESIPKHQYQLSATGGHSNFLLLLLLLINLGTGEYIWYSSDSSVISVNAAGVLTSQRVGETTIIVADKKNPMNTDSILAVNISKRLKN